MAEETSHDPAVGGSEARIIRRLVKQVAESEGFPLFQLSFDEDSTGTPAVWISFLLDDQYPTTKESIQTLTRLGQRVKSNLFEHNISRVPYIRFRERRRAAG
jgi:hypothetical protein